MTKVYLDFGKVKSTQTDLNSVASNLNYSSEKFSNLSCPYGFRYARYVNSISGIIRSCSNNCKNLSNNLDKYYSNYIAFNSECSDLISNVNINDIKRRANRINKIN